MILGSKAVGAALFVGVVGAIGGLGAFLVQGIVVDNAVLMWLAGNFVVVVLGAAMVVTDRQKNKEFQRKMQHVPKEVHELRQQVAMVLKFVERVTKEEYEELVEHRRREQRRGREDL